MSELFVDAFYYIALLNGNDQHHQSVIEAAKGINVPLVTTSWVLVELGAALSAPAFRSHTFDFIQQVLADPQTTVLTEPVWFTWGLALFGKRPDKGWSLTDCISFEVMRERGIYEALTGDHHFAQAGFRALLID